MSTITDEICEMLDTYSGRDKVVRLACYTAKLYGCMKENKSWLKAGSQLSHARMLLRLFDDIPLLKYTYNYGFGREESTYMDSFLGMLANIIDTVYLPVEKACWFCELGVLKVDEKTSEKLDVFSTVLWASSLYVALLQSLRTLRQMSNTRDCMHFQEYPLQAKQNLDTKLRLQTVVAFKLCLDITHAVSCLPQGWLWGERIGATKVAAVATTSSLIGIGLYFAKKKLLK